MWSEGRCRRATTKPVATVKQGVAKQAAAADLQRHFPERFTGERHLPLCRWANGNPIKHEQLQEVLH